MTKLQAKNLMVGDYVQCPETNHIFKVQTISGGEQDTLHYVTAKNGNGDFLSRSEWDGVPLTKEILEKNGLKFSSQYDNLHFPEDDECRLELSLEDEVIVWSIEIGQYSILPLQYVHELQHALRLCRIKKEIEL